MMPTQVAQFELQAAPSTIPVRNDVHGLLLLVTSGGRPVDLLRIARPASGAVSSDQIMRLGKGGWPLVPEKRVRPLLKQPISIVVCTRERPDDLRRCLESLVGIERDGHEVLVVDNAPVTDRTASIAARFGVRSVVEPTPGLNRARNAGVAASTRDVVAFVDDDVVVSQPWPAAMTSCLDDPQVGCATGLVLPLELETDAQEDFEAYCQHRRDLQRRVYAPGDVPSSSAGVVGMGANMAFRRNLLSTLGGFDPRLDAGTRTRSGGDTDMFARVLDAGRSIVYTPDAYVWHRHRRSAREVRSCVFGYGIGLYGMLTKRVVEQRDLAALVTAGRWLVGPLVKAASAKLGGRPSPRWDTVLAETAGAPLGPIYFAYETWRNR